MKIMIKKSTPSDAQGKNLNYFECQLKDMTQLTSLELSSVNNKNIINEYNEQISLEELDEYQIKDLCNIETRKYVVDEDSILLVCYDTHVNKLFILDYDK